MRLLFSTDFALRLLMRLGEEPGALRSAEWLAQAVGVPRNHVHKLVQELAGLGLVRTVRGARGGVVLARAPGEVRLGAVVRHFEADQALVACFAEGGGDCPLLAPECRLRGALWRAREAFLRELDARTLADCLPVGAGRAGEATGRGGDAPSLGAAEGVDEVRWTKSDAPTCEP